MSKSAAVLLLMCMIGMYAETAYCEQYEKFQIKLGIHEKAVNDKYGMPLVTEKLKKGFLPIPKKKALYKINDSDYMILYFFSGRVKDVTILEDAEHDEAVTAFKKEQSK